MGKDKYVYHDYDELHVRVPDKRCPKRRFFLTELAVFPMAFYNLKRPFKLITSLFFHYTNIQGKYNYWGARPFEQKEKERD